MRYVSCFNDTQNFSNSFTSQIPFFFSRFHICNKRLNTCYRRFCPTFQYSPVFARLCLSHTNFTAKTPWIRFTKFKPFGLRKPLAKFIYTRFFSTCLLLVVCIHTTNAPFQVVAKEKVIFCELSVCQISISSNYKYSASLPVVCLLFCG